MTRPPVMASDVARFTPGPWSITDRGDLFRIRNDNDEVVATTDDGGHPVDEIFDYETQAANAHLIAAAPELYEALVAVRSNTAVWHLLDSKQADATNAALARARGESA